MTREIKMLLPILETLKDREMQAMAALQREITTARAQIASLDEDAARISQTLAETADPATQASAARWRIWNQQRRMRINADLAQLMVQKEALRSRLSQAVGRHDVVNRISEKARAEQRKKAAGF